MAKVRIHKLAKELGITSKRLLEVLKESSEFIKSVSSIVEAPVVRKTYEYIEAHPELIEKKKKSAKKPASQVKAGKSGEHAVDPDAEKTDGTKSQSPSHARAPEGKDAPGDGLTSAQAPPATERATPRAQSGDVSVLGSEPGSAATTSSSKAPAEGADKLRKAAGAKTTKPAVPEPDTPKPSTLKPAGDKSKAPKPSNPKKKRSGGRGPKPQTPRPGNNPFAPVQGMPHPSGEGPKPQAPRPDNNPFAPMQGMPRPSGDQRQQGKSGSRSDSSRPHSDAQCPDPSMVPDGSSTQPAGRSPSGGNRGHSEGLDRDGPGRPGNHGGGFARSGRKSRGGSTAGTFGRRGGRPSRGRKSRRAKREEFEMQSSPMVADIEIPRDDGSTVVRVRTDASLTDFAERIGASSAALITALFYMGEMVTASQSLDEDAFALLGAELGYDVRILSPKDEGHEILEAFNIDLETEDETKDDKSLAARPPAVTVMGHVDHGETKPLGAIRSTHVIDTEHDGVTQYIGVYQVHLDYEGQDRAITFIGTPGREAFTQMRARGADVTDIAIPVVAVDDGVIPQTIEAVNHAQTAGIKIIIAVNEIDVDGASPERTRGRLTRCGIVTEEYGGDTMFAGISAKPRIGIDDLPEAILYMVDADLDLRTNPNQDACGIAIEVELDQGRGAIVTAFVQTNTFHIGGSLVVGTAHSRVRAMFNGSGGMVEGAEPPYPVQILGMSTIPATGGSFLVAPDDRTTRQTADRRKAAQRAAALAKRRRQISLENLNDTLKQGTVQTLSLVIRGGTSDSIEVLESSLLELEVGNKVALQIVHRGMGAITQNDVSLAAVDSAIIIGFNVRPTERVQEIADREDVDVKFYSVICSAIEDVEAALKDMLKPIFGEVQLAAAEIRQVFRSEKFGNIAGSIMRSDTVRRGARTRLVRDGVVIAPDLEIVSLRREEDDVTEIREGYEYGITLGYRDIREGDLIETSEVQRKPRD